MAGATHARLQSHGNGVWHRPSNAFLYSGCHVHRAILFGNHAAPTRGNRTGLNRRCRHPGCADLLHAPPTRVPSVRTHSASNRGFPPLASLESLLALRFRSWFCTFPSSHRKKIGRPRPRLPSSTTFIPKPIPSANGYLVRNLADCR
jgi:hypothetical protein